MHTLSFFADRISLLLVFLSTLHHSLSQVPTTDTLSFNNANAIIANNGIFFHDYLHQTGGYDVPKDSNIHAIYFMSIQAIGTGSNGEIHAALTDYNSTDFQPGPIAANYSDSLYQAKFGNAIWNVSKAEIDAHIANWNSQGYIPATSIVNWPGNGNTQNGEAGILAPFFDQNNDGIYTPTEGDYPLIRGDRSIYVIINDDTTHPSNSIPLQTEVHLLFYQFNTANALINTTTFINATFYNRGSGELTDFQCGLFADFDLGFMNDDYSGCYPAGNLIYCYNGDLFDQSMPGVNGYGESPPAIGLKYLNQILYSHYSFYSSAPGYPDLLSVQQINHLFGGLNPSGDPILDPNGFPDRYMYNDINLNGWNEYSPVPNPSGDCKAISTIPATTLSPLHPLCLDFAIIFGANTDSILTGAVNQLIINSDTIQNFYDLQSYDCFGQVVGTEELQNPVLKLYPNPANDVLHVEGIQSGSFRILSPDGKMVFSGVFDGSEIQIGHLKAGYYFLIPDAAPESAQPFLKN